MQIVLASSSNYRAQLLKKLRLPFIQSSPGIDEARLENEAPYELVKRLASTKAEALKSQFPNSLIIGSDQVAIVNMGTGNQQILTKPGSKENAFKQLSLCSGKQVTFLTGLTLLNTQTKKQQTKVVPFNVYFNHLSEPEIGRYIALEQPFDCAGSFKSEGLGICLFERMEGDDPNALVGLPLIALIAMLKKEGESPLA